VTPSSLGLQAQEERGPDRTIQPLGTGRTAFVGRALRGPVNRPVLLRSFSEFQNVFGGLWQPSRLSYAVEHFFDNGGREALVVRVVNGARAATLTLRAGAGVLTLRAVSPGTREFLRVSVDYDNIPVHDESRFNLTVQRVRVQGGSHVEDQEIFRDLSTAQSHERHAPVVLAQSQLARIVGDMPAERPDRTLTAGGHSAAYVASNSDGDDGAPLTDYDLIGSEIEGTGLFALGAADYFNLLCIPPLSRAEDVGPSVWLVAARYCRDRRALLVVDPPSSWHTADDALHGLRDWEILSENALMYFPRVLAHDKLRGHFESFAPCGAVAGMLARIDLMTPVWGEARIDDTVLRPGYRPTCLVGEDRRMRLLKRGVNTLQAVRSVGRGIKPRTLAAGTAGSADGEILAAKRLALLILNSIERATRWVATTPRSAETAQAVAHQTRNFFERLYQAGAFGTRRREEAFYVFCDQRTPQGLAEFHLLIGFACARRGEFHGYRISHAPAGSTVVPASLNRARLAELCPEELDWVDKLASQLGPP